MDRFGSKGTGKMERGRRFRAGGGGFDVGVEIGNRLRGIVGVKREFRSQETDVDLRAADLPTESPIEDLGEPVDRRGRDLRL